MKFLDLLHCLQSKAAKWDKIGLELSLSADELDIIRVDSHGVEECLINMLQKWHRNTNPTWKKVISALRTSTVGEEGLAQELENRYITKETCEVVKENLARIKGRFANLVTRITQKLKTKDIDMEMFHIYMITLFPQNILPSTFGSVVEIFKVVSQHQLWDYLNYTPIEAISNEFGGDDPELRELISDYKSELTGFKATSRIVDYIKVCGEEEELADSEQSLQQDKTRYDKRYCHKLTIKLKAKVTEKSLDYIDQLWRSIADHFLLPSLPVLLDSIQEGCIEVTWLVPMHFALHIKANIQDSTEFFRKWEVSKVVMEDEILYDDAMNEERLLMACENGNINEVAVLLTFGMDVDTASPQNGVTLLHVVAKTGNLSLAEMLLKYHANVNKQDNNGITPLMVATFNGHIDIVQLLLQHHPDIDTISKDGITALSMACHMGNIELASVLLQHKASPNVFGENNVSPLMHVLKLPEENLPLIQLLLEAGASLEYRWDATSPLILACYNGHINAVKLFIEKGVNINAMHKDIKGSEWTSLIAAARKGHLEICQVLLKHGALTDPSKTNTTPLMVASKHRHIEVVRCLLEHGANVHATNEGGLTALHFASGNGHVEIVKVLHMHGALVDVQSENGYTPLMYACLYGYPEVVEYFLEQKVAVNTQNKAGLSPLMLASDGGYSEIVTKLLAHGANTEQYTHETGLSALMVATRKNHFETVKRLLLAKALVDHTEKSAGWSALFFASKEGNLDIVKLLIEHGADLSLTAKSVDISDAGSPHDQSEVTAYDVASVHGWSEVCEELENHGYRTSAPPTEEVKRQVELSSNLLRRTFLDMENINTFRDVLRHGIEKTDMPKFDTKDSLSPTWQQPETISFQENNTPLLRLEPITLAQFWKSQ